MKSRWKQEQEDENRRWIVALNDQNINALEINAFLGIRVFRVDSYHIKSNVCTTKKHHTNMLMLYVCDIFLIYLQ